MVKEHERMIGLVGTSRLENERRVPIYPEHLPSIDDAIKNQLVFEYGYGKPFGYPDAFFVQQGAQVTTREHIFSSCDILVLPKPVSQDIEEMKSGQVLWGWAHCVQQKAITQAAIDTRLTIVAWESMHHWSPAGEKLMHIFYKNNEIAGYAAILHVLQIYGLDGHYGPRRSVSVIGYGAVSRGAIYALQGRGFNNIHVYTRRPVHLVADQNPDVYYHQLVVDKTQSMYTIDSGGGKVPFIEALADSEIICNGVLQDTDNPLMFVDDTSVARLRPRCVIADISCDKGMGFSFAQPTSFESPTFEVGDGIRYYSVDHTPSYLWDAASREISRALIPYLAIMATGPHGWKNCESLAKAVEIQDGIVMNPKILSFQKRSPEPPYLIM